MASLKKVEDRTKRFIAEYERLSKGKDFPTHDNLAVIIGAKGKNTITEILGQRQNIQPDQWDKFVAYFGINTEIPVQRLKSEGEHLNDSQYKYIKLLEGNDHFFKNEYAQLLISLNKLIDLGRRSEALIKLNLEHIGNVEAIQKGVSPEEIHEQINNQIVEMGPYEQTGNDDGN